MTLDDIIRRDEDRVFAVDPECFIIFTGEALSDTRPFIRVGNWIDLPAELIPLIENIIITDTMAGNPAHEQFNIDIKYLPVNRYIGSHSIVRRYLDYQKVFGLDLHNASVVDAERDIPDISTSSAVSDRESFMGIFYNNGNFRIVHNRKKIFDLWESCDSPLTAQSMHEKLTSAVKNPKRYAGCGMVILDGNPLFYRASAFASYLFPLRYYSKFSDLEINPRSIQTVIHPSENFLSLARFLKWKHGTESKITLYCDSKEEAALQKSLFSKARIDVKPFTGMKADIVPGVSAEQKIHSFNIALSHSTAAGTVRTAFIKGPSALQQIARERYDALFIPYSVFEDCVSSLRSSASPVAVIDDGNPSVVKIPRLEYPVLRQNVQYEFVRASDDADAFRTISELLPDEITAALASNDADGMKRILGALKKSDNGYTEETALNTAALATHLISVTADRKHSASLKSFARELFLFDTVSAPHRSPSQYRFDLVFTGKGIFETAHPAAGNKTQGFFPDELRAENMQNAPKESKALCARIIQDRERLEQLLSLYAVEDSAEAKELASLRTEIQKRKDAFRNERASHPEKGTAFISALRSSIEKVQRKEPHGEKPHPLAIHHHIKRIRQALMGQKTSAPESVAAGKHSPLALHHHIARIHRALVRKEAPSSKPETAKKSSPLALHHHIARIHRELLRREVPVSRPDPAQKRRPKQKKRSLKHIFITAGVAIALLLSGLGIVMLFHSTAVQKKLAKEQARVQTVAAERARLKEKYRITVNEYDVYLFANQTAIKNGYAPIPVKDFNRKNPHWIFPGNVFILADGEEVRVKDGDTLWMIARAKLERMYIAFYVVIDAIQRDIAAGKKPDPAAVRTAQSLAMTAAQKKLAASFYGNQ